MLKETKLNFGNLRTIDFFLSSDQIQLSEMKIIIANKSDVAELAQVEIESKKQSIPELIEDHEIDLSSRIYRWQTYFKAQTPQTSKPQRIT